MSTMRIKIIKSEDLYDTILTYEYYIATFSFHFSLPNTKKEYTYFVLLFPLSELCVYFLLLLQPHLAQLLWLLLLAY